VQLLVKINEEHVQHLWERALVGVRALVRVGGDVQGRVTNKGRITSRDRGWD
jgi:hypothetical protein